MPFPSDDTTLQPRFRLIVRPTGSIVVIDWSPRFARLGPLHVLLESRARARVSIADLTVIEDDCGSAIEAILAFRCGGAPDHRAAILTWAASVGYRRLWLGDEVIELSPCPGGAVETRCCACGTRLVDAEPAFWTYVRSRGAFPTSCVLCGGDLRQWKPVRERTPAKRATGDVVADEVPAAPKTKLLSAEDSGGLDRGAPIHLRGDLGGS